MTDETILARIARLYAVYLVRQSRSNWHEFACALSAAWRDGQLIALDMPENGEPALIWADEADIFDNTGIWTSVEADKWQTSRPYIAISSTRSAMLAAEAKGLMDAAQYVSDYAKGFGDPKMRRMVERCSEDITAAAAKLESGQ